MFLNFGKKNRHNSFYVIDILLKSCLFPEKEYLQEKIKLSLGSDVLSFRKKIELNT